ncbi:SAM-dependent methyltransferase [Paenibacillus selenitireducens]|uniref:SAM-dependent methyltransferase n=1 Tax=Paenibacillus selenitireducens TaxID=1324314 RepID=A0A1T2X9V4_9BACL|nr:class I SAM-dependent methyltransferase [Paenibacillus selenitireducens]OPA76671.1 SAM-dependent methyltransferase [Paenibacillus selenitireducens]
MKQIEHQQAWNAQQYDHHMAFVSAYGKDVMEWLRPQAGEHVIDWGCGTGDLTAAIAASGASVLGIDFSREMIEEAQRKYPSMASSFEQADGQAYQTRDLADAVFSNAALHWMKDAHGAADSIFHALKPGGRFVAEFGGKGNIESIANALTAVLRERGWYEEEMNPWYFPSIGEYTSLLESIGFQVQQAVRFERPTTLGGGEQGLEIWLDSFAGSFVNKLQPEQRRDVYNEVAERIRPKLMQMGQWQADYCRLRVYAVKKL